MTKIGVEVNIDVKKIDKARLYQGQKGTYLTMTTFIDLDQKDQYDNNGFIAHKKNEGEQQTPILGNVKVFWRDDNDNAPHQQAPQQQPQQQAPQQQPQQQAPQGGYQNQVNPTTQGAYQAHNAKAQQLQQAPKAQEPNLDFSDDIPF